MEFAKINCLHVYIYYCREYNNNYKIIAQDNFFPFLPHSIVVSKPIAATSENQSPSQIFFTLQPITIPIFQLAGKY
jgi:hypothetical protein